MSYQKLFNPTGLEDLRRLERAQQERTDDAIGDRRDGKVYAYDDGGEIVLAVNIALATGRPLLLSGHSGGGKSSLAHHVARVLGRRFYEFVVTARTQAQDLTWRFDAVRRLADAQVKEQWFAKAGEATVPSQVKRASPEQPASDDAPTTADQSSRQSEAYLAHVYPYLEPQALWWIFDRANARRRGRQSLDPHDVPRDPCIWEPRDAAAKGEWLPENPQHDSCVLLIDEIDKADPDVPNNLLVELGSLQFTVDVIGKVVSFQGDRADWQARPLVIITTNKERPLPLPFVRRCIVLEIPKPKHKLLWAIAAKNFPDRDQPFFDTILKAIVAGRAEEASDQPNPGDTTALDPGDKTVAVSIAEYLDTVRACIRLQESGGQLSEKLLADIVAKTHWIAKQEAVRP